MNTGKSNKPKVESGNPDDVQEDRISILPEEILYRILSYLYMTDVIKTSVLSTRWRNLWKSHPFVQFSKDLQGGSAKTLNCINHILSLRDSKASNIQKLAMQCYTLWHLDPLQECIVSAVNQGVQEVDIMVWTSSTPFSIELNSSIFTSGVVRVFKFAEFRPQHSRISLPCSIGYAIHLRFLKLFGVTLPLGDSNQEMHLSCPNLETLIIKNCHHSHLKVLDISTPQLSKLVIFNCPFANAHVRSCKLGIHTLKLSSFRYNGCSYLDYSIMENFPFLDSVDITLISVDNEVKSKDQDSIIKLLRNGFSNAKRLTVKGIVAHRPEET